MTTNEEVEYEYGEQLYPKNQEATIQNAYKGSNQDPGDEYTCRSRHAGILIPVPQIETTTAPLVRYAG